MLCYYVMKLGNLVFEAYEAKYSVAYEKTQSNRASDFRDLLCSLFPKEILFYFYFSINHVIMLNTRVVLSTPCNSSLNGCVMKFKRWVILSKKHVNLSIQLVIMQMGVLFCAHNILFCQKSILIC